ncbi:MAG TPA: phosphatase PAP2 family protein [Steroidobacteraceae bacterium]
MASASRPQWTVELGERARSGFVATVIATSCLTALFFVGYFYVQRHPAYAPITMPLTPLDRWIPFQPRALLAYVSLWIYLGTGPGLQRTLAARAVYGLWLCGLGLTGLAIFYLWPTQIASMPLPAAGFPALAVLHRLDQAGNACPSMHVAVAIFTAIRIDDVLHSTRSPLWLRSVNTAWFIAIVYSTLAIRQHVLLDVAAGAVLGLMFVWPSLRWRERESARHP